MMAESMTAIPPLARVGPALPQALRLTRCQAQASGGQDFDSTTQLSSENDIVNQKITREEERLLAFNLRVVSALEDLYSLR